MTPRREPPSQLEAKRGQRRRRERHRGLNPVRLSAPPRPRRFKDRAKGNAKRMADPEQRERESRESEETKFEERLEEEASERADAAERIRQEPPLEQRDDDGAE